jgi:hypothetical protein
MRLRLERNDKTRRVHLKGKRQYRDAIGFVHLADRQDPHEPVKPWLARKHDNFDRVGVPHSVLQIVMSAPWPVIAWPARLARR